MVHLDRHIWIIKKTERVAGTKKENVFDRKTPQKAPPINPTREGRGSSICDQKPPQKWVPADAAQCENRKNGVPFGA